MKRLITSVKLLVLLALYGCAAVPHTIKYRGVPQPGPSVSLPTQTSHSGQFLTTNGTTASWGVPASTVVPPSWVNAAAQRKLTGITSSAGNFSGCIWDISDNMTLTGARWYQPAGHTANVTITAYYSNGPSNTLIVSQTFTPTADAINTVAFSASHAITSSFYLNISEAGGTGYQLLGAGSCSASSWSGMSCTNQNQPPQWTAYSNSLTFRGCGSQAAGATSFATVTPSYAVLEPVYTVP